MKTRIKFLLPIVFVILFAACKNEEIENNCPPAVKLKGERKKLNISIFLDLSDRISPTFHSNNAMEYWERDLGYISSISEAFEIHLRNKKTILMDDNIRLFLHPLPQNIDNIDDVVKSLDKSFSRENATLDNICSITNDYSLNTKTIYTKTLAQKEPIAKTGIDDYPGSDIFDFFKSRVKDYCIKENHRNILFILTDGYMFMSGANNKNSDNKSNFLLSKTLKTWGVNQLNYQTKINTDGYGFQVPVTDLNNLEVFVIGLVPQNSWELDVLNLYWHNWFKEMGVKNFQDENWSRYIKQADLPSELHNLIQNFIYE